METMNCRYIGCPYNNKVCEYSKLKSKELAEKAKGLVVRLNKAMLLSEEKLCERITI